MADQWDDTNNGDDNQQNNGRGLRQQLEQALTRLKAVEDENGALKAQARTSAISTVITAKGLDAKVAKLIPKDVESTPEGVQKWLDEYGDLFNIKQAEGGASGAPDAGSEGVGQTSGDVDPDEAMAFIQTMRQMGNVGGGILPPAKAQDLLNKINDPNLTQEGLMELITAHGGGVGLG